LPALQIASVHCDDFKKVSRKKKGNSARQERA